MAQLQLKDVSYRYRGSEKNILEGVDAAFLGGKLYAVVGPSGSGKSTLLSLMAGLDKPDRGALLLDGQNYDTLDMDLCRRRDIAMIFQAFQLFALLTVQENVCFPMELNGVKKRDAVMRAQQLLASVDIPPEEWKRYPANLSGGEQQRVAIARALASGAGVILADEPTGNLDADNSEQVLSILLRLAHEEGRCVIVVTHDLELAARADEVLRMRGGRLVPQAMPNADAWAFLKDL